jgi:cytochrome c
MTSLSYSQVAQISSEELKELKKYEKEKELYSKECVAQSINFAISKKNKEFTFLNIYEMFSCYLAIILARDKEVVAVWLKILQSCCEIYLSKNSDWLNKDIRYIDNITKYLKNISKNAPVISKITKRIFSRL